MYSNISCSMEVGTPVVARGDSVIIQQGPFGINRRFCCGGFRTQVSVATEPLSASPPLVLLSPQFFTHCQLQDACRPRWGIQRRVYSCWFHHCLCFVIARVCVFNCFCFILPTPFPPSLGPKHTLVRETTFHWELLAPQTTETFHCQGGIWHRWCHTAVPPPPLPARGRHHQFPFVFWGFFSPPSPPTKESNRAMVHGNSNSTSNRPQQTGNNLWSSEDASRQPRRAQRRKDFTRSSSAEPGLPWESLQSDLKLLFFCLITSFMLSKS